MLQVENIISSAFRHGVLDLHELAHMLDQMLEPVPFMHPIDRQGEASAALILEFYWAHGQAGAVLLLCQLAVHPENMQHGRAPSPLCA